MNAATSVVVDLFLEHGLPLLSAGSTIVLTLKNFDGSGRRWRENVAAAVARVAAACGLDLPQHGAELVTDGEARPESATRNSLRLVHLLANGPSEVTLYARLPAHWRPTPGAGAGLGLEASGC